MFKGSTAWFSRSVGRTKRQKWLAGGGKEASYDSAQFVFSQDAHAPDTQGIFEGTAYLDEHLSVFHANYISECVKKGSMEAVALGKYILLPLEVQKVVQRETGIKFQWQTDGNTSDGQSIHSDSEDEVPGPARTSGKPHNTTKPKESDPKAGTSGLQSDKKQTQSKMTKTADKQKENQSSQKQSSDSMTENQSQSKGQKGSPIKKQENQSTEIRKSNRTLKDVKTNNQSRNKEEADKNVTKNREKLPGNTVRKGSSDIAERPTQEKRPKLSEDSIVATDKEEIWRLENLAKVTDKIDDFAVGHRGYDVYDKRRKKKEN